MSDITEYLESWKQQAYADDPWLKAGRELAAMKTPQYEDWTWKDSLLNSLATGLGSGLLTGLGRSSAESEIEDRLKKSLGTYGFNEADIMPEGSGVDEWQFNLSKAQENQLRKQKLADAISGAAVQNTIGEWPGLGKEIYGKVLAGASPDEIIGSFNEPPPSPKRMDLTSGFTAEGAIGDTLKPNIPVSARGATGATEAAAGGELSTPPDIGSSTWSQNALDKMRQKVDEEASAKLDALTELHGKTRANLEVNAWRASKYKEIDQIQAKLGLKGMPAAMQTSLTSGAAAGETANDVILALREYGKTPIWGTGPGFRASLQWGNSEASRFVWPKLKTWAMQIAKSLKPGNLSDQEQRWVNEIVEGKYPVTTSPESIADMVDTVSKTITAQGQAAEKVWNASMMGASLGEAAKMASSREGPIIQSPEGLTQVRQLTNGRWVRVRILGKDSLGKARYEELR
jgi:hypothetical protein